MPSTITVNVNNDKLKVNKGISLSKLNNMVNSERRLRVLAAMVDNKIKDLNFELNKDCSVKFLDLKSEDGVRVYKRSLFLILMKAIKLLYPSGTLKIRHSISRGTYCEIHNISSLDVRDVKKIENKMKEFVSQNLSINKHIVTLEQAREIFNQSKEYDKISLLHHCKKETLSLYSCGDTVNYLYGCMVPSTEYLDKFELMYYYPGFILRYPDKDSPFEIPSYEENRKLFQVLTEHKKWGEILNVSHLGSLNEMIASEKAEDLIRISEALHEKKIAYIADKIKRRENDIKIVFISGPSSSGKTTFAKRLAIHLRVNGFRPITISLDDYFVDRKKIPVDENGKPDFEALEAIDYKLFNEQLSEIISGKEIEVPIFNFNTGKREEKGRKLRLEKGHIIIVEGIHGLNEKLTPSIPFRNKFKIYVSALTQLSFDNYNPSSTTDTRLIRRIVRDHQFRSSPALKTLKMWNSVRAGEKKNIFPFQEQADVMFNSALAYELSVLRDYALPLLEEIENIHPEYSEARRLIDFLSYFLPLHTDEIPNTSIIREFIGGNVLYK